MGARKSLSVALLVVVALPLLGAMLSPTASRAPAPAPARAKWSEVPWQCPGHMGNDSFPTLAVADRITNIPEYHDCQRFIAGEQYDSLYAIFVASNADRVIDQLKRLECNPNTRLTNGNVPPQFPTEGRRDNPLFPASGSTADTSLTTVNPDFTVPGDCRSMQGGQWNSVAVSMAEIASWGGDYPSLGIKPFFNCLFIYDSANLKAKMVPVGQDDAACLGVADPSMLQGQALRIRATYRAGLLDQDYPPVGKWDTDPKTGGMYISMVCGGRWCEVGPEGLTYSKQGTSSSADRMVRRVVEVKGWYDEQRLGVMEGGKIVPSKVVGRYTPEKDLDSYTSTDFQQRRWLPSATVYLTAGLQQYKTKLNFTGPTGGRLNRISMCIGNLEKCVPQQFVNQLAGCAPQSRAFARIRSTAGIVDYRCMGYNVHGDGTMHIPGTVRWAWYDKDEGGWMRCPSGCCYPT